MAALPWPFGRPQEAWLGAWCALPGRWSAGTLAAAGYDWVCLDAQHGAHDDRSLVEALTAPGGAPLLVRVRSNDAGLIGRALDAGAAGVIVPVVDDAAAAARAAAATHYPPLGARSWGPLAGLAGGTAPTAGQARSLCAVMVETPAAVAAAADIAAVPGVDALFVGPYDLALSSGTDVAGLLSGSRGRAALTAVVRACAEHGVVAGAYAGSLDIARALRGLGFTMLAVASDAALLADAAAGALARARTALGAPQGEGT
jgi:4-hydroxy-2-oxoheptanedioate aldolase